MRNSIRILALVLASTFLGAWRLLSPAAQRADLPAVAMIGTLESMDGTRWIVHGQAITVDQALIVGRSFQMGDAVQVDAVLVTDGSFSARRILTPGASNTLAANDKDK